MSFKVEAALTFMSATSKIDRHAWNERDAIVSSWHLAENFNISRNNSIHCTCVCSLLHYT